MQGNIFFVEMQNIRTDKAVKSIYYLAVFD